MGGEGGRFERGGGGAGRSGERPVRAYGAGRYWDILPLFSSPRKPALVWPPSFTGAGSPGVWGQGSCARRDGVASLPPCGMDPPPHRPQRHRLLPIAAGVPLPSPASQTAPPSSRRRCGRGATERGRHGHHTQHQGRPPPTELWWPCVRAHCTYTICTAGVFIPALAVGTLYPCTTRALVRQDHRFAAP